MRFFPVYTFVLPCVFGTCVQGLQYGISTGWFAVAMALMFVEFQLQKEEAFVDDFIEQTTFPITLQAFYNNLLTYLGLENGGFAGKFSTEYSNLNYNIKDNFQAINITGR